jgi:hypothetical protein
VADSRFIVNSKVIRMPESHIFLMMFLHIKCRAEKGNLGVPLLPGQGCSFYSFKTNTYKLNFMESPAGIKVSIAHSLALLRFMCVCAR